MHEPGVLLLKLEAEHFQPEFFKLVRSELATGNLEDKSYCTTVVTQGSRNNQLEKAGDTVLFKSDYPLRQTINSTEDTNNWT